VTAEPDAAASGSGEQLLFVGRPAAIAGLGGLLLTIFTVGLAWIVLWIRSLGRHYRITTQRIVVEHGVFSKRIEQIDTYRIIDYVVELPFGQRLLGTGNILLKTHDTTTPTMRIDRIRTDVRDLYERLRVATEAEKRRRGVRMLDVEGAA
jgi:uncharacterized membrane protein YdbT with pleckstrin-like domain